MAGKEKRDALSLSQDEMAEKLGISGRMYSDYERGLYDDSEGDVRRKRLIAKLATLGQRSSQNDRLIPIYDVDVSAGAVSMFDDGGEEVLQHTTINTLFQDCDFGIRIYGHSMYPTYPNGIYVICKQIKNTKIIPYGECFLVITDEYRMVKRLLKSKYNNFVLASSDNEQKREDGKKVFSDFEIPLKDVKKLYLIKGQARLEQT